jgi:hypothetical protein
MLKSKIYEFNRQPYTALLRESLLPTVARYLAIDALFDNYEYLVTKSISYNLFCIYYSPMSGLGLTNYILQYKIPLILSCLLLSYWASFMSINLVNVGCLTHTCLSLYVLRTNLFLSHTLYVNSASLSIPVHFMSHNWLLQILYSMTVLLLTPKYLKRGFTACLVSLTYLSLMYYLFA